MTASTYTGTNGAAPAALPAMPTPATWTEAPASVNVKAHYRGFDVLLTLRGDTGRDVLGRLDAALTWLEAAGATPTATRPSAPAPAPDAPVCPAHGTPMREGRRGGWYCPAKLAEDDGTGKPAYCRHTNGGVS